MPKRISCILLSLAALLLLTVLPSCQSQNAVKETAVTSADTDNSSPAKNTDKETPKQAETLPETQTEAQPEAQPETQTEAQPESQSEPQPEPQTEAQPNPQTVMQTQPPSVPNSTAPPNESAKPSSFTASSLTKQSLNASDGTTLSYWLYTPENAVSNMPLLVYLHGGSGKGNNLDILLQNGFPNWLNEGSLGKIPAYIVIPQLSSDKNGWTDIKNAVRELVTYCCKAYGTDANRVSLTGHSMGGTGTWNLAVAFPSLFSCIAPMSGSITVNDATVSALSGMSVWAFVGSADKIVKPDSPIQFIEALKKVNGNAQITIFNGADHFDVPGLAFQNDAIPIVQWLITQSK